MSTYRIMTSLQDVSGMAKDRYVNTWYFSTTETPILPSTLATLTDGQIAFYTALQQWLSAGIGKPNHTTKIYLVGAPKDTPPVLDTTWAFVDPPGSTGSVCLPGEVAICATFHADPQPGVHRQSWRGRIYFGPLNSAALGGTSPGNARPYSGMVDQMGTALGYWDTACNAAGGRWVIYSRKLARVYPVARASVDDAWDTQRRRGVAPTKNLVDVTGLHGAGVPSGPV